MLKKVEFLPKEILIKKYAQISGKDQDQVGHLAEKEGIEEIADRIEEYYVNQYLHRKFSH